MVSSYTAPRCAICPAKISQETLAAFTFFQNFPQTVPNHLEPHKIELTMGFPLIPSFLSLQQKQRTVNKNDDTGGEQLKDRRLYKMENRLFLVSLVRIVNVYVCVRAHKFFLCSPTGI